MATLDFLLISKCRCPKARSPASCPPELHLGQILALAGDAAVVRLLFGEACLIFAFLPQLERLVEL